MSIITVYGASDDLVEIEGVKGADEFSTNGHWIGVIEAPDGKTALLYADYRNNGTWTVSLGQYEEDYELPNWVVITLTNLAVCSYSTLVHIHVPEGTTIKEYS